jgi:anaerobic dimethyl sulfoxide reductase subunit B (iron-sulfur subunit)
MNEHELGFVFHKEKCIQCLGCEGACKVWRSTEPGIKWRRVLNLWQGEYPDVKCSAMSVACHHCAEPACVGACPVTAIRKTEDGPVLVDRDLCTGCRACHDACPYGVPQFGADGLMQKCDMCAAGTGISTPPCVHTCPTGALEFQKLSVSLKRAMEQTLSDFMK